jgi:hypothetical protein
MKAAAARAWFEITDLHPFGDGNGQVARSVASRMLIRGDYALVMDPGLCCHAPGRLLPGARLQGPGSDALAHLLRRDRRVLLQEGTRMKSASASRVPTGYSA